MAILVFTVVEDTCRGAFRILFAFTDIRITVLKTGDTGCGKNKFILWHITISISHLKVNGWIFYSYYRRKYDVEFVWNKQFLLKQVLRQSGIPTGPDGPAG
jgi:hypothetical protein